MITENFVPSKARPVARKLKVNANLSSADKEFLITVFFVVEYRVFLSSSLNSYSFWFRVLVRSGLLQDAMQFSARIFRNPVAQAML